MKNSKIFIANGVSIRDLTDSKFKSSKISINFIMPLNSETATHTSILTGLLSQSNSKYPSITLLSKHLNELYGADVTSHTSKYGDCLIMNISVKGIADKFALENENLSAIFSQLLSDSIFLPNLDENKLFPAENFEQEKRQLIEAIDSEINEKRLYANSKCREMMFEGEAAQTSKYGTREDAINASCVNSKKVLQEIINNSLIDILVLGNCNFETVKETLTNSFNFKRDVLTLSNTTSKIKRDFREVIEEQNISQSKLILGFKFNEEIKNINAFRLLALVLGGTASSKFFLNVREKMSLCYYCSAQIDIQKSVLLVDSGIETKNIEISKNAILKEIEDVKNGIISDDELLYAKLDAINSYKSLGDTLLGTETFYAKQILNDEIQSVDEVIAEIQSTTKEDIVSLANSMKLDTVFVLKGVQSNE